jgi:hypothetical protein
MRVILPAIFGNDVHSVLYIFGMSQVHIEHTLIYEREKERDEHRTEQPKRLTVNQHDWG